MNASQFLSLIQKSSHLESEDYQTLSRISDTFPYFQISAVLTAKHDFQLDRNVNAPSLHAAAVKSTDRIWMKSILENDLSFIHVSNPENEVLEKQEAPAVSEEEASTAQVTDTSVIGTTEDIETTAQAVETSVENIQTEPSPAANELNISVPLENPSIPIEPPKNLEKRADILKRLDENLSKLKNNPTQEIEPIEEKFDYEKQGKSGKKGEDLIESIKKKEKRQVQDTRKKEQMDIIKAFSKKEIKLAAIKENEDQQKLVDLAKDSTQLNDDILSESYARLLIQQGKKEKAKEIYQKLSLKFPKKKAYFADLLKDLN